MCGRGEWHLLFGNTRSIGVESSDKWNSRGNNNEYSLPRCLNKVIDKEKVISIDFFASFAPGHNL